MSRAASAKASKGPSVTHDKQPYEQRAYWRAGALSSMLLVLLAGCGGGDGKSPSQVAAKVNKEELSVHQVNQSLQRQPGLKPEQAETARRQVLEQLIDQELAVQRAQELKLDREPRVVQAIEAARREIIARAYAERLGESVNRPTADEIGKYYAENAALFSERRVYSLQEVMVEARPEQLDDIRARLKAAKSAGDFIERLKAGNYRFGGGSAVRAAEQLPLAMLPEFAKLQDGQAMLAPTPSGAQVVFVVSSRSQPVDVAAASPAIEQFLLAERRRKLLDSDAKSMRAKAQIEYVGPFAVAASTPVAPTVPVDPTPIARSASGAIDSATISRGLGLK